MKTIVKLFTALMLTTIGTSTFAQEVYPVTQSEFEGLQSSPVKMEEIKSQGMVIKIVEETPVRVQKQKSVTITQNELASYKKDEAKFAAFLESCDGKYEVVANPVKIEPARVQPSAQDLQKLELEKQMANKDKTDESFVPMRERSGDDVSSTPSTTKKSLDHGSGMGGNASDVTNEEISNPVSTELNKEERYEANRKFDKAPH